MDTTLVTSYENPDLDGIACVIGYTEFLNRTGTAATPGIFGAPQTNSRLALYSAQVPPPPNIEERIGEFDRIVILDVSNTHDLPRLVEAKRVVEVIDHRPTPELESFTNAKAQIEQVGSCATLVAERFRKANIIPSRPVVFLLYSAIMSDTYLGQAPHTTQRDRGVISWLSVLNLFPASYGRELLLDRSRFSKPLREVLLDDYSVRPFGGKNVGALQIEVVGLDALLAKSTNEIIHTMEEITRSEHPDYLYFIGVDMEKNFTVIIAPSQASQEILRRALGATFSGNEARLFPMMVRKQIGAKVKVVLES